MSIFDWDTMIPEDFEFNYVTTTEVVAWDPDEHEEVRFDKRSLIAGE